MAQYLVGRNRYGHTIAKFEDSTQPLNVYSISNTRCRCPARTKSCKHLTIFRSWEKNGSKIGDVLDDSGTIIHNLLEGDLSA